MITPESMYLATVGNFFQGPGLIILLVVLLMFGAKKLPELAKGMGQAIREFNNAKEADSADSPKEIASGKAGDDAAKSDASKQTS